MLPFLESFAIVSSLHLPVSLGHNVLELCCLSRPCMCASVCVCACTHDFNSRDQVQGFILERQAHRATAQTHMCSFLIELSRGVGGKYNYSIDFAKIWCLKCMCVTFLSEKRYIFQRLNSTISSSLKLFQVSLPQARLPSSLCPQCLLTELLYSFVDAPQIVHLH